jgi:hypothetical protein
MAGTDDPRSPRSRLLGAGATWAVAAVVAVAAAHPEGCSTPTGAEARSAATAAVGWLATNQRADGSFLYRYDRDEAEDLGGYSIVRHAGVLLALAQAEAARIPGAEAPFRAGLDWARDRLVDTGGGVAPVQGAVADTGAVALLTAALVEWREATGETGHDALLRGLGSFLAARVTAEGAVTALVEVGSGSDVAGSRSPFSTGEAAWALAALHTTFPDEGWDGPARSVLAYLASARDDRERRFPPVSDHWAAYALAEVGVAWGAPLTGAEQDLLRRQAGLFGLQTRYESQRRASGPVRWTRGPMALGAGVGTLGEGLGAVQRLAVVDDAAAELEEAVRDRQRCVAGLLVDRQVMAGDGTAAPDPGRVGGAWFHRGVTQMDDQQHALSALLAAVEVLPGPDPTS